MSKSYLIEAVRDEQVLARGTAWFVDDTVVTAFHVVGEEHSGEWLSAKLPGLQYRLLAGADHILLEPLIADEAADIALLKPARTPADMQLVPLEDATVSTPGASWYSEGFPVLHDRLVFGLNGTITRGDDTTPARALQLTVAQGAQVDWSGVSGAPVWIGQRVAGLITYMTSHANTGWAASAGAIRGLYERLGQSTLTPKRVTRHDIVRRILQELSLANRPGVALLEPLRFDARSIVQQVMTELQAPGRHMLVVRLVPNPHTTDEKHLYGTLYRDLKRGIQDALGQEPLPQLWQACFDQVNNKQGLIVEEMEFQFVLEVLLNGPVRDTHQHLVLIVEGLSTVKNEHVQSWGWLLQRLSGPLKLLVWGGEDLYQLCVAPTVGPNSVFHRLTRVPVEPFSQSEVTHLVMDRLGMANGSDSLYALTHGHPALVYEVLESAVDELLTNNIDMLRERLLTGAYLNCQIKPTVEKDPSLLAGLRRLQCGETAKRADPAWDRLRWLGVIREQGVGHWNWTAPVLTDWARRWLGSSG